MTHSRGTGFSGVGCMETFLDDFTGIDPIGKSPSEIEFEWFSNVYRGDLPQLTTRAVLMGCLLGGVMSLSNLFVGLKTGWGLGVAITACVLSYSLGAVLKRMGLLNSNLSILENNCMQSAASSAGYSTGSTMVSAVSALLLIEGHHMPFWTLMAWTVLLALLGVFLAIPMKRQMINIEQLRFPSGVAAAQTLRSLYAAGEAAARKAKSLGAAAAFGGALAFLRENSFSWWPGWLKAPEMIEFPGRLAGQSLRSWTVSFEFSGIMAAAGAIIGMKVACSMLAGGILNYLIAAPYIYKRGIIQGTGYKNIVAWSLWGGTALMVASGLLTFAFQWKTVWRAIAGAGQIFQWKRVKNGEGPPASDFEAMESIEVPGSWFAAGLAVSGIGIMAVQTFDFSISWSMGALSVIMSFFLSVVACRATGETDITPIGAMGKITQLSYGIIAPSNITANLMTAGVTAGAAASSADLLTDLKSGYLLGANPKKQFIAQFLGIFAGAAVIVPSFYLFGAHARHSRRREISGPKRPSVERGGRTAGARPVKPSQFSENCPCHWDSRRGAAFGARSSGAFANQVLSPFSNGSWACVCNSLLEYALYFPGGAYSVLCAKNPQGRIYHTCGFGDNSG